MVTLVWICPSSPLFSQKVAVIPLRRILSTGPFFGSAAWLWFVLLDIFCFLFCRAGFIACLVMSVREKSGPDARKKRENNGGVAPVGDDRWLLIFFLGAPARTSMGDGFEAGFTVRLGMIDSGATKEMMAIEHDERRQKGDASGRVRSRLRW